MTALAIIATVAAFFVTMFVVAACRLSSHLSREEESDPIHNLLGSYRESAGWGGTSGEEGT